MLDTILFDLDGTLIPFSEKEFVNFYFPGMAKKLSPMGVDPEKLIKGIWAGTGMMQKNDGSKTNSQAFWDFFEPFMDLKRTELEPVMGDFYSNEFDGAKAVLKQQRDCSDMIAGLKEKGYTVALATNPIFPINAVETRLNWVGLHVEDFALVTSYETSHYTKPSTGYYEEVLARLGKSPGQCMMIGNNSVEDTAVMLLGIPVILLTDTPEGPGEIPQGAVTMSYAQVQEYFETLPEVK